MLTIKFSKCAAAVIFVILCYTEPNLLEYKVNLLNMFSFNIFVKKKKEKEQQKTKRNINLAM